MKILSYPPSGTARSHIYSFSQLLPIESMIGKQTKELPRRAQYSPSQMMHLQYNIEIRMEGGIEKQKKVNDSDKTKDTLFQVQQTSLFLFARQHLSKLATFSSHSLHNLVTICEGASASDKIVRLASAIIKFVKNFQIIVFLGRFDKFSSQITQLRRLLRINRMLLVMKDYIGFIKKVNRKRRDFFDLFFKTVMLLCDINDMLAYLMQLRVIKERGLASLKKNVANIYFCECVLWCCLHTYDYLTKDKTEAEIRTRRINIVKYLMDTAISHNDFSMKRFSIGVKQSTLLGLISSVIGLALIWK